MKRITLEEAKKLIACEEDFFEKSLQKPSYFTLEKEKNGWETVKYYTSKLIKKYKNREGEYDEWVYILSNPSFSYFKIGKTKYQPEERARQLSRETGVPLPFEVEWAFNCWNAENLEKEVHRRLENYRINKEFFQINLNEAKKVIIELGKKYT